MFCLFLVGKNAFKIKARVKIAPEHINCVFKHLEFLSNYLFVARTKIKWDKVGDVEFNLVKKHEGRGNIQGVLG